MHVTRSKARAGRGVLHNFRKQLRKSFEINAYLRNLYYTMISEHPSVDANALFFNQLHLRNDRIDLLRDTERVLELELTLHTKVQ